MANEPNVPGTVSTAIEQEKTFTQEEVDRLITNRLERERKKYPGEDELTAFRTWKESQKTEQEKLNGLTKERDDAKNDLAAALEKINEYEHEKYLISKGVPSEDVDYFAFKISKLVTDKKNFEQAAEEFLKEKSPGKEPKVRVDITAGLSGGKSTATPNEAMNALIRNAFH